MKVPSQLDLNLIASVPIGALTQVVQAIAAI